MAHLLAYDSTAPHKIPADAPGVIAYADGDFAWSEEDLARFPGAARRFISVTGNARLASGVDVERFDVSPRGAPVFLEDRKRLYPAHRPWVYVNRANLGQVQAFCARLGFDYDVWLATLDGTLVTSITGGGRLVAVQAVRGPGYDLSVVLDPAWLRAP